MDTTPYLYEFDTLTFNIALANPMRTIPSGISPGVLSSTSKDEFLSRIQKEHPQILVLRFPEIEKYIKQTYEWRVPVETPRILEEGTERLPNDIGNWASNVLREGKNVKEQNHQAENAKRN